MTLESVCVYFGLVANATAVVAFAIAIPSAFRAWHRFRQEKAFERMAMLYSLANEVFRQGLTIQKRKGSNERYELQPLIDAVNALKNWFFDYRFFFMSKGDTRIGDLMEEVNEESKQIANTGSMDKLCELRSELEERLS